MRLCPKGNLPALDTGGEFTNATVLQSVASLNEAEYPPKSGTKVVCDIGGPMRVVFSQPIKSFTAYVTHTQAVTLKLMAGNGGTVTSSTVSGDNRLGAAKKPNEAITVSSERIHHSGNGGRAGRQFVHRGRYHDGGLRAAGADVLRRRQSLAFDYVSGRPAPAPQSVYIAGEPDVAFEVTTPTPWIQAISSRGKTPANVSIAVHPEQFAPGTYYGSVVFTSSKERQESRSR